MNSMLRLLALMVLLLTARCEAGVSNPENPNNPVVPQVDPEDGLEWRGDQFHAHSLLPKIDGHWDRDGRFEVRSMRWGYSPAPGGKWQINLARAAIETRQATRMTYLLSPFWPQKLAGHAALLIEFSSPDAIVSTTGQKSSGLVISVEARVKKGDKYGLAAGLTGHFPLVWVLSTWEDYQQSMLRVFGCDIQRYTIAVTSEEARRVAIAGVNAALEDHTKQRYYLLTQSCITSMIDYFNAGVDKKHRIDKGILLGMLPRPSLSLPAWFPRVMARKKILGERLPDLVHESPLRLLLEPDTGE